MKTTIPKIRWKRGDCGYLCHNWAYWLVCPTPLTVHRVDHTVDTLTVGVAADVSGGRGSCLVVRTRNFFCTVREAVHAARRWNAEVVRNFNRRKAGGE